MSSVSLKNLTKAFGPVKAVDDVSVVIEEGEFFSLLGPSGCGKSTTLRMIAGFEEVTSGAIELDGQDVSGLPPEARGIGFVFQNYAIFPHMNVFENIAFGLRLRKFSESDIRTKVAAALEQVGMTGLETRMQSEMSGGQQQRVALARVLVTEPKILLLDEPLSALDKNLREEMKYWIKDLQSNLGITTIYVTHDQGEALTMSDRIAVMNEGTIAQVGEPREIYEHPGGIFVAEFIGESSLLKGKISAVSDGHCRFEVGGQILEAESQPGLSSGSEAVMVLRPERVLIADTEHSGDWNGGPASVKSTTYQGPTIRTLLDFEGQEIVCESANRHDAPQVEPGQKVFVAWPKDASWLLTQD
ncbi:ABC transporter ATP-binding protein [Hoeflea sp.]|uniref:ABC transporter ATP-binding protein n=1 Tax=Hoeflea sp. TaxID=1940281 RepID=UPI003B02DC7D